MYAYYILYCTVNLINGKLYVGAHCTNCLNDGYLGSGKLLHHAIKKYGRDNFVRVNLEYFNNADDLFLRENQLVNKNIVDSDEFYNIALGGTGSSILNNRKPFSGPHTPRAKKKLSDFKKKWHTENENPYKGKVHSGTTRRKISANTSKALTGRNLSESHKRNLSLSLTGKSNKTYTFISKCGDVEEVKCLTQWCKTRNLDYNKVYQYIDNGAVKMIERYRSKTREWFEGSEIRTNNGD